MQSLIIGFFVALESTKMIFVKIIIRKMICFNFLNVSSDGSKSTAITLKMFLKLTL